MINWIQNVFSRETKASLRRRVADQQHTIDMLMGRPMQQLAKLAYECARYGHLPDELGEMYDYMFSHADALRCLDNVEIPTDE